MQIMPPQNGAGFVWRGSSNFRELEFMMVKEYKT